MAVDDLVNSFKDLRKDMVDQKSETKRLNRLLRQEQEARKEEIARLNRSFCQGQEARKADSARHKETQLLWQLLTCTTKV